MDRSKGNNLPKEASHNRMESIRRGLGRYFSDPFVAVLAKTGISPNGVTWLGFAVTVVAAGLAAYGYLLAAGLVSLFAAFFDTLDGALARRTNRVSKFGGILDSTLDRVSEGAMLLGILMWYVASADQPPLIAAFVVGAALIASFLVSYIRARYEAMGVKGEPGISTRTERVILTALGLILSRLSTVILFIILIVIAVMSWITVGQRLYFAWQQTKENILTK
jgi:CDP-diacylglycerol---glycerol-3-phosphate 3-phosphatidyltransferase